MGTQPVAPPVRTAHHSNPFLIPMVFIGGVMGVLAAYGVLAIIRDHGARLKPLVQVAEAAPTTPTTSPKPNSQQRLTASKANSTSAPLNPPSGPQSRNIAVSQPQINSRAKSTADAGGQNYASLKIATDAASSKSPVLPAASDAPSLPPPEAPSADTPAVSSDDAAPASLSSSPETTSHDRAKVADTAATAAIVPLDLKQGTIRVIAIPEDVTPDSLLCDIGFSPELTSRNVPTGTYDMAVQGLGKRGEYRQQLPLQINGAGAVIDIAIRQQNKALVCEISPKFSLPMTGVKQLTLASGSILKKGLNKTLDNTLNAQQELPGLRVHLADLKAQLATAIQNANGAAGNNINQTGNMRIQWRTEAHRLQLAVIKCGKDIDHDEDLVANKSAVQTDIADLDQISQFVGRIANASLSVRFYNGDITIPATVR